MSELRHEIQREGIDYDVDQPMGWIVVCSCGQEFDHIAPEGARDSFREHLAEQRRKEDAA